MRMWFVPKNVHIMYEYKIVQENFVYFTLVVYECTCENWWMNE